MHVCIETKSPMNRRQFLKSLISTAAFMSGYLATDKEARSAVSHDALLLSREKPLSIDAGGKRVLIYTELNREGIHKKNPHWGVVSKNGKLADKGILNAFCEPLDFYDALVQIGAKPGNNLTEKSTGQFVAGDRLIVNAARSNAGREVALGRIFHDSSGKGFSICFGGNRKAAEDQNTGCITCLESCWVGITSNAAYPLIGSFKRFMSPNSLFSGNPELISAVEDRPVILSYRLA
jgi:hypothetical protein